MAITSTSEARGPESIRRLLFRWVLTPLAGLLLLTALLGYPVALHPVTRALDWALLDTAHSIARLIAVTGGDLQLAVSSTDDTILRSDEFDRIYYSVHAADGRLLAGDPELVPPARDRPAGQSFYDGVIDGERVRIAAVALAHRAGPLTIQVAETTVKRTRLTQQILSGVIFIEILLIATAAALVSLGINKGLQPLQRLRTVIAARSHRDLRPLPESQAPVEAQPLVSAINRLLEQISAMLGAQQHFVANAAHQLRTPLAGLRMQIEYALNQDDPEEWRHALSVLAPVTERTVHLVNQLLTLAKADAGSNVDIPMEAIDVRKPVEEIVAQRMPQAIAKNIDVGLELQAVEAHANPFLLSELLGNLVDNAITYSGRGGRLTVRTTSEREGARIEIEDDGPGIPDSERRNVFARFYRLPGSAGSGCGLGLAIVEEIAQLHCARVEIRTPASGRGTLIAVIFPVGDVRRKASGREVGAV